MPTEEDIHLAGLGVEMWESVRNVQGTKGHQRMGAYIFSLSPKA